MTIYARLEADGGVTLLDLDPALINKWVAEGNVKATLHRIYVIDPPPTPSATQKVVSAGYVIEPTQVRHTHAMVNKSAAELSAETDAAELAQLQAVAAALQAGTGTAAERIVRVERVCVWLLKQAAKRGVI